MPHHPYCEQLTYAQFKSPSFHLKSFPLVPSQYSLPFLSSGQVLIQRDLNLPKPIPRRGFLLLTAPCHQLPQHPTFQLFAGFAVLCLWEITDLLNKASSQGTSAPPYAIQAQAEEQARRLILPLIIIVTHYPNLEGNWKKVQRILLFPSLWLHGKIFSTQC